MEPWFPKRPESLEEAKVTSYFVRDSILKALLIRGVTRGFEFADLLKVPFSLIEADVRHLSENHLIGPVGGTGLGGAAGVDYGLTKEGRAQAHEILSRNRYLGPAPVELDDYRHSVRQQKLQTRGIRKKHVEWTFRDLVVAPGYLEKLGPALNSGGPIFLYGKPGNGKTTISERLARLFRHPIYVPYAIQIDGQIIRFADEKVHIDVAEAALPEEHPSRKDPKAIDARWRCVQRPFIIVGGELTLAMLDLIYHEGQAAYEAPFQLKANCGVLLVDDFGRQIVKPKDFLNRWIFPLEKGIDFLTLMNGKKVDVPFDPMLIFSTNIEPKNLADEAFWRRIKYKLETHDPTKDEYERIFRAVCEKVKIPYDQDCFEYMIKRHYHEASREFRAVHPRDIVGHVRDLISYRNIESKFSNSLIDQACETYFGSVDPRTHEGWNSPRVVSPSAE